MGIEYAVEKMSAAIGGMAVSTKPLQKRIEHAYLTFHPIQPDRDLPSDELRERYAELMERLTAANRTPTAGTFPQRRATWRMNKRVRWPK